MFKTYGKAYLIERILQLELEMFLNVPAAKPARCQDSPEAFKLVRGSIFKTWPEETLAVYLADLMESVEAGRNLMSEKYARMDNLIPCLNLNSHIDEIVKIETAWQQETQRKYPHLLSGTPAGGICKVEFNIYLRCELETYSDKTIESYFSWISHAKNEGVNPTEEKYRYICQKLGYESLAQADKVIEITMG
jgi:hypothetical protein